MAIVSDPIVRCSRTIIDYYTLFLLPANEVWSKVIFSEASVILFPWCRDFCLGGGLQGGLPTEGSAYTGGGLLTGGSASRGWAETPSPHPNQKKLGSTYTTGMHSCLCLKINWKLIMHFQAIPYKNVSNKRKFKTSMKLFKINLRIYNF